MAAELGSLDHLMLFSEDVPAAVAFYRETFDAGVIEERYPHWARLRLANVDIGLHHGLPPGGADGTSVRAAFRVQDMPGFRRHLESRGVAIHGDYHDIPGGVVLTFGDPFGNALQAIRWGQSAEDVRTAR